MSTSWRFDERKNPKGILRHKFIMEMITVNTLAQMINNGMLNSVGADTLGCKLQVNSVHVTVILGNTFSIQCYFTNFTSSQDRQMLKLGYSWCFLLRWAVSYCLGRIEVCRNSQNTCMQIPLTVRGRIEWKWLKKVNIYNCAIWPWRECIDFGYYIKKDPIGKAQVKLKQIF